MTFNIIHPGKDIEESGLNQVSLTAYLQYGEIAFMFTGDIEKAEERELISSGFDLNSTILKVGHHGSNTSTTGLFLEAVTPEVAVITVGKDNKFDHPAPEVINRLQENDVEIYRTDLNGDIVITTDGNAYSIERARSYQEEEVEELSELNGTQADSSDLDLLNINQASKSQLETLWGVGPVTADNIIEYRNEAGSFQSIEEIKEVDGIDINKFKRWKDQITI